MSEALFDFWVDATRAQGIPALYSKTDLEMFVMRVFDRFTFKAGKSQREKRRSFEELWDISGGNTEAIAYGFNGALRAGVYSLAYVKACIKNWSPTTSHVQSRPTTAPPRVAEVSKIMETTKRAPPKKKTALPVGPTEKVEWK